MREDFVEYRNAFPLNTIRAWSAELHKAIKWEYIGWSGAAKEPYRHWAAYPDLEGEIKKIWLACRATVQDDGYYLNPERVIANLYAHGDSSWVHRDCPKRDTWTLILYLNDFWDINWGGETIIAEGQEIVKSFAPTPGKLLLFRSNLEHGARPVSREAPYPRFGLTFQCSEIDSVSNLSSPVRLATKV